MGKKVFVSYRYADDNVQHLSGIPYYQKTTVRDYVDWLEQQLGKTNIYKGEHDGEDLSHLSESTIERHLTDKIFDSSVTIVLVSPGMRDMYKSDSEQWIPWEIAYSVRRSTRGGRTSQRNALLAVVLPDRNGSYTYARYQRNTVMPMILCENLDCGYAVMVEWDNFKYNRDKWIANAAIKAEVCPDYKICKTV